MTTPYFGSGRGITTDNFFTSIPLAEFLLQKKLTLIGTLRANKAEIPKDFLPDKKKEVDSSFFGFTKNMTLVSYVPKKGKAVILLSTQHNDLSIDKKTKKPTIIMDYNNTKGGVDVGDMMTRQYSCVRQTRRWPYRLFMEIVDIAALNAFIVWKEKNPDWEKRNKSSRRVFLQKLALQLVQPHIKTRYSNPSGIHHSIVTAMKAVFPELKTVARNDTAADQPSKLLSGKRCEFCPRKEDRKTRICCAECKKPLCKNHRTEIIVAKCISCNNQ